MKTRTLASILACCFFLVLLQLLAAFIGPVVGAVCGAALAVLSILLLRFFQIEIQQMWVAVVIPTASSLVGIGLVFFDRTGLVPVLRLAPLLACGVSGAIAGIQRLRSKRCDLCNRRLGNGVSFACPRCPFRVCDSCWVFERIRCRLCEKNHVPVLLGDGKWWDKQLGPRVAYGRCQLCMTPAGETDLRACRHCGRPQ